MLSRLKNIGPGALVAAAFIGPGTVTAATLAGATYGYALLWALLFAVVATITLQEMSARLGTVAQKGLGEALRESLTHSPFKWPLFALVIVALYIGNAAYEAGNLSGAALGIEAVAGPDSGIYPFAIVGISLLSGTLLWFGSYKQIEKALIGLVLLMAVTFLAVFVISDPDFMAIGKGLLVPSIPEGSLPIIVGLIGTTVVPYNLFLHASAAKARWHGPDDLPKARFDTGLAIGLGGLISILVTATAAASFFGSGIAISNAGDMALQFKPLFGPFSQYVLGTGFFAAGLSSAITAPLATAYVVSEIFGFKSNTNARLFRLVGLSVVLVGALLALTGIKPISIIISAQLANGLLLPIIAAFLLYAMNSRRLLGQHANGRVSNVCGALVILVTLGLGVRLIVAGVSSI